MSPARRARRLALWVGGVLAAAALALGAAALMWLPSDEEVAARISTAFTERTGVEVDLAHVHWSLWPAPTLVIENAATRQARPIVVRRIALRASWRALLDREVEEAALEVTGAVVSRESLSALRAAAPGVTPAAGPWKVAGVALRQVHVRDLTWVDRRGIELVYEGDVELDADGRPRSARVARANLPKPVELRLKREGDADRWQVLIDVPGGTWNGQAELTQSPKGRLALRAELTPKNVDVEALTAAFHRRAMVAGRANGSTTVKAEGANAAELIRSLHTQTRFSVKPARLTRFDLSKAVSSAGSSTSGQTPLDELTGVLDTQNTGRGVVFRYTELRARSGALTASGQLKLFNRKLDGEGALDLVDGVVGIPVKIGGTMEEPELSLTGGALAGAAVGTAVLPGVGTAIGARLGQQLGRLLGEDPPPAKAPGKAGQPPSPAAAPRR